MSRSVVMVCLVACSAAQPKPPTTAPTSAAVPVATPAPAPAPAPAESTAARLLKEWFTAFNAEDYGTLHAWRVAHTPDEPEHDKGFREMTGGFEIRRMKDLSATSVEAIVKGKTDGLFARAELDIDPKDPERVVALQIRLAPPPGDVLTPEERKARTVDAARRAAVVDEIANALARSYIKPDKAASMAAAIRAHLATGDYDGITDGEELANRLTDDLHADTRDLHMGIRFGPHPKEEPPPPPEAAQLEQLGKVNFGFGPIERLPGNIARVEIDFFPDAKLESVRAAIGERMSQVADADALIIDLRKNGGGDSDTVVFIAGYLFGDKPVRLNDIYEREANKTTRTFTPAKVPGKRFGRKKPVFVLTSNRTFSGGEDFAYTLQATKRAIVIGETTGGGAHPVEPISLDDQFLIMMPYAESISPITHGNWEGTGVIPDVPTKADAALDEALKRATAAIKH